MSDTIKISLELADNAASKVLSEITTKSGQAEKNFKKLGDTGTETFKEIAVNIGKSIGVFDIFAGNIAANVVTGAFNSMLGAADSLFQTLVVDGVKASQESEDALNALNVALAQSGNYSAEASQEFQNLAKFIQEVTAVEDDAVIKNAALLASLTNLDNQGLQRATVAAVELSQALGKDLQTTTEAIAKAANGNTTSLQKMGIQFEKSGTQAGTFDNALKAIEDKFGGVATSKLNTFSGAVAQAENAFGNLQEEIGAVITQNPAIVGAIAEVSRILTGATTGIENNKEAIKVLVGEGFVLLIEGSKFVVDAIGTVGKVGTTVFSGLDVAAKSAIPSLSLFLGIADEGVAIIKDVSDVISGASGNTKELNTPLQEVSNSLTRIGAAAQEGLDKLKAGAVGAAAAVDNAKNSTTKFSDEQQKLRDQNNSYVQGLANENANAKSIYDARLQELQLFYQAAQNVDSEADEINYTLKLEREAQYFEARSALLDEQKSLELKRIDQSTLDDTVKVQARLALDQKYYLEKQKLDNEYAGKNKAFLLAQKKQDEVFNQAKLQATADVFGSIGRIAALGGKKNFEIVRAFNLAEAITAGVLAVQKAAASAPPPFNIPAIVSATATSAANVAQIVATRAPAFEDGGIVPGSSFSGDKVIARVNSREMILNDSQQAQLFKMANGQVGGSGLTREEVAVMIAEASNREIVINVDGRELARVQRDQKNSGRSF